MYCKKESKSCLITNDYCVLYMTEFIQSGVSTLKLDTGKRVMGDYSANRESFDASDLLKSTKFNNYNFGRICVDEILLSSRSSFTDGYYTTVSKLAMK